MVAEWSRERGWRPTGLTSYSPLPLAPSAMVLHYGQAIFEGLKAYPRPGGVGSIFRPRQCAARFNRSAARLAMPAINPRDHPGRPPPDRHRPARGADDAAA
jgi:branched-chain amino acid aminotransferase